jgi:FKBP-type peptidyl-prolyl cis-trans isomerase FkpA
MIKKYALLFLVVMVSVPAIGGTKDSINNYVLPDSVKAVNYVSGIVTSGGEGNRKYSAGIRTSDVSLFLETGKKSQSVVFMTPKGSRIVASGLDVKSNKNGRMEWAYPWAGGDNYKLYIASAADSAGNFVLYSGYIFLPKEGKWKLLGTCRISGKWGTMDGLQSFASSGNGKFKGNFAGTWVQRNNGRWYNLNNDVSAAPVLLPFPSIDSIRQSAVDQQIIAKAIQGGKLEAPKAKEGIYYWIMKEGSGKLVNVTDTVTVFYKGYLFNDGTIFDQTDSVPRTFPLSRLIRGWQIGLSGTKTGSKVKLLIPSGQGYWIRTRAAKIPPNSILVFEIEVVDAK